MIRRALLAILIALPLLAQTPFEGTVSLNLTNDNGRANALSFMIKGGKMRFDPSTGPNGPMISVILDNVAQRMTVIMNQQKMYMEREFPSVAAIQSQTGVKAPALVKTGKTEVVAGYKCEHYTITDNDGTPVDTCINNELGGFRMPTGANPMAPQSEAGWITQLPLGAFPLKVQKGGKTMLEVTSIEKKALDPELFLPPMGFTSFQMPKRP